MRNLKLFLAIAVLTSTAAHAAAQSRLCSYEPLTATQDDEITVCFNAALGNAALAGYDGTVYAHAGVLTDESSSTSDWKHACDWLDNSEKYAMTSTGGDIYTLTLTPADFFGLADGETVRSLAFVFRDADGQRQGKTAGGGDIIVPFVSQQAAAEGNIGAYQSHTDDGTTITVTASNGVLYLTPYSDGVVKVLTTALGDTTGERRSISVCATPDAYYTVAESDDALTVATGGLTVEMKKSTCALSFRDADGTLLLAEDGGMDNHASTRVCSFLGMNDAGFYGGGYNGRLVNFDGSPMVMDNTQAYGWESSWTQPNNICIPFYVSTSGYGVLFDDHYRGATITPSAAGTTYTSGSLNPVAYYFVGGGTMEAVMENYTALTGRQEMPPYWTLGYLTSRYGYQSQAEAEEVVRKIKDDCQLPLDGIVLDLYWQGADPSGMGNLDWYAPNWQSPSEMMAGFLSQGVRTICITEPFFTSNCANYATLNSNGYLADADVDDMEWLLSDRVGLIDASNPAAMDWMWEFYRARTEEGVGGWWLDLGEPERHDADSRHQGGTVEQVHNEFNDLWVERVYRGMKELSPTGRPFLMPRSGTAGMQRYSVFPWTGDIRRSWSGLQAQVPALVSAGMSGVGYLGSDVGGFVADETNPRLYLRWVEQAVFSPMMRTHSTLEPEPYNAVYSEVLPAVRSFINLRYRYLPYLYTLARENATAGTPLARPVNFYSPESGQANCTDAYLWGKDIFVAPVLTDATSRSITFPEGTWIDMNDYSASYQGGSTVAYDAPLETLPHFARKGSFIPAFTQTEFTCTDDIDHSRLTVFYFMDDSADGVAGSVFDDDKATTASASGDEYLTMRFYGSSADGTDMIDYNTRGSGYDGMPESRTVTFVMPNYTADVESVTLNELDSSTTLPCATSAEQLASGDAAGYYHAADNTLYVKVTLATDPAQIAIARKGGGVDAARAEKQLRLSYAASSRQIAYTLPSGCGSARVDLYTPAGALAATLSGLPAGEGTHRVDCPPLPQGVYVARLSAEASGSRLSAAAKIAVR